mmetsp:Transcript_22980/g.60759  ORF Transcript_22980/g.60759 Transcript_22980/m.60759 type:complete len:223 (-) Transcript_22980:1311-1979(-)
MVERVVQELGVVALDVRCPHFVVQRTCLERAQEHTRRKELLQRVVHELVDACHTALDVFHVLPRLFLVLLSRLGSECIVVLLIFVLVRFDVVVVHDHLNQRQGLVRAQNLPHLCQLLRRDRGDPLLVQVEYHDALQMAHIELAALVLVVAVRELVEQAAHLEHQVLLGELFVPRVKVPRLKFIVRCHAPHCRLHRHLVQLDSRARDRRRPIILSGVGQYADE